MEQTTLDGFTEIKDLDLEITKLEVSETVQGFYAGSQMGKFGYLIKIGDKLIPANDILWGKVNRCRIGDILLIKRLEDGFSEKRQVPYKNYEVFKKD